MATWVIGDIQGCYRTLQGLLERIEHDPSEDRLWLVGDLVNRGPASLEVLRWARSLGHAATAVLGNHDVKLLAIAEGAWRRSSPDTLEHVLAAEDRDDLLHWLRERPLAHAEGDWLMVHAGVLPTWTAYETIALAEEVSAVLRGRERGKLLRALRETPPPPWSDALTGIPRLACVMTALTRLRTCTREGVPCDSWSGAPDGAPEGCVPWFDLPRRSHDARIVFGHWAALGVLVRPDVVALDSGCVWGRHLTAFCLEDGRLVQEACVDDVPRFAGEG